MKLLSCIVTLLLFFSAFTFSEAQVVTIKQVQLAGEKIIVTYDLEDGNPNNEYWLELYSSKDNFVTALTKVKGDVGMDIKPGPGKKIEWEIMKEYGPYKGKLSLEIKGKVYVPFVRLQGFDANENYKRGKTYTIKWKAGNSDPVSIELYKAGQRIAGDINQPNNGTYHLYIPAKAKPGKDYRIKLSNSRKPDDVLYTSYFRVSPKLPLLVKVGIPVVAAGVAVVLFSGGGGGGNENGNGNGVGEIPTPAFPK